MLEPKILVCADFHLGRSSAWLEGPEEIDRSAVGAWGRIVDHAIGGQATAVAIAGDIFDGVEAYYETRQAFREGLLRLKSAGIPVVAVAGNHDWIALPRFCHHFPDDLILLGGGGRWESRSVGGVTFVGWSFPAATHAARALDSFRRPATSEPVVGLVHGDVGNLNSPYHPVSPADLLGADAWGLGHIHLHSRIGATAVYPGSPQALDFGPGELGAHGFVWLTFPGGHPTFSELVPTSTVWFQDWHTDEIVVSVEEDPAEALERVTHHFCDGLLRNRPGVQSVQLRVRALLSGPGEKPATLPTSPDPRFCWQFLDVRLRDDRDPWREAQGADAAAEVARLLVGALSEHGRYEGRDVDPEWIRGANTLIDRSASDVRNYWDRTVAQAADHFGESGQAPPTAEEAWEIARLAMVGELWEMLRRIEVRPAEVAA